MTPDERSWEVARNLHLYSGDIPSGHATEIHQAITSAIREAVAEEREAIKKLVATYLNDGAQTDDGITADGIAAIILYEIEQRSCVSTYDPVEMPK